MTTNRRRFLGMAAGAGAIALARPRFGFGAEADELGAALDVAAARPVLDVAGLKDPVIIESIELLRKGREHFLRVRSKDGAEGISVDNGRADILHPILNRLVAPYFIGKDARDLEEHLFGVYREGDNYKYQGLALWCPVAMVEFAILDLLGRIAGKSIGELLGGVTRTSVPFYVASGRRDTTPQQEIDYLKSLIEETGAKAVKYRVGGRMSRNEDASPGRTETLIPLSRKALGDKIAIHADSNSSYDAEHAIPVGRMLEDIDAVYFEEPCPFDDFESTKKVTDALTIPIALGEQEFSHARFRAVINDGVADIVQPDLFYYGGLDPLDPRRPHGGRAQPAHHRASVGRIRLRVLAALRGGGAEHRPVAGVQARRGDLRQVVRSAAADRRRRTERADRARRGNCRSAGGVERSGGCSRLAILSFTEGCRGRASASPQSLAYWGSAEPRLATHVSIARAVCSSHMSSPCAPMIDSPTGTPDTLASGIDICGKRPMPAIDVSDSVRL